MEIIASSICSSQKNTHRFYFCCVRAGSLLRPTSANIKYLYHSCYYQFFTGLCNSWPVKRQNATVYPRADRFFVTVHLFWGVRNVKTLGDK